MDDHSFDWDDENAAHIRRHAVTPNEVEEALQGAVVDLEYQVVDGEERWRGLGRTAQARVLVVVWTMRDGRCRPIAAFDASRALTAAYFGLVRGAS